MDVQDMASLAGLDEMEAALAERGIGLVHYDVVTALAEALGAQPSDLYPGMDEHFDRIDASERDESIRDEMLSPERSVALLMAGIDPDISSWYAIVRLKSGNERRYRVSSTERENIRSELAFAGNPNGFIAFAADCRTVLVRREAIAEVKITTAASYAPFSSRESAYKVVIVSPRSPRPEEMEVVPDGGEDGDGPRPFSDFVAAAQQGGEIPGFILLEEDGDEVYVAIDRLEAMEIPMGVLMPGLYGEDGQGHGGKRPETLEEMEPAGKA